MERWLMIKGYEGLYMISDRGNVKSLITNKILSNNRLSQDGYIRVSFRKDGKSKEFRPNRLVAQHFLPEPKENQTTVNHINGIKTDNRLENLEWASTSEQMYHAYANGLKKPMRGCKVLSEEQMKEIKVTYQRYKKGFGSVALASKYGVESTTILRVVNGKWG